MRNRIPLFTFFLLCLLTACKKEKVIKATNISNGQAAVMAATALSVNAYGLAGIKNDITLYAKNLTGTGKGCGIVDSFAVARQEPVTSNINYNYGLGYYYTVNCSDAVQDNLTANVVASGSFDAATLTAVNTSNIGINLSSLTGSATIYTLTGNYQTSGSFQTIDDTQLSGNNNVSIDLQNLTITKSTRAIAGGNANISITGTVKNKNTFSYDGTVVFSDATTAVLTLDGTSYTVNLVTADVTAM